MPETTQFAGMSDDGSRSGTTALQPNTILLGRYKILGEIGGGGMGTVYQARDLNFPDVKKLVAIKEMHNPATDANLRASTLQTFQREANILATLSHPAIPKIFEFFSQSERAYLVMEFINGNDLEQLLGKTKELPIEKIIDWAIALCDVLDYLHKHEPPIIFRDMKPSNIMIDSRGNVRLIDFGIAKAFQTGVKHTMIGTEGYSAPEQYKGDVTPLSDIYSLGATLHHILTRKDPRLEPPFSFNERPIKQLNEKVPQGLIDVIEKALNFSPAERYQSCDEMKTALEALRYPSAQVLMTGAMGGKGKQETEFFPTDTRSTFEPKWKFRTEDEIRGTPAAYRDLVFVGSYDTNVWALKQETGEFVWKHPTGGGIAASPIVDEENKLVMFGSEDFTFYAVDFRTGRITWSHSTKDRIRSTARCAHGYVFFGSDDGRVYALAAHNGRWQWEFDMGAPVRVRPFVTNELIIVGCESGEIVGIELSGNRKWAARSKRSINSSPFVDEVEEVCFVGSLDYHMYAYDATSGYSMWRFRTSGPIISSPYAVNDLVYFGSGDGYFYAVNAQNGKEKWKFNVEKPIVSSPVVHNNAVYFGGTDGNLYCLDATNGKELWKFPTEGPITGAPQVAGDVILVGSIDKTLYALPLVS